MPADDAEKTQTKRLGYADNASRLSGEVPILPRIFTFCVFCVICGLNCFFQAHLPRGPRDFTDNDSSAGLEMVCGFVQPRYPLDCATSGIAIRFWKDLQDLPSCVETMNPDVWFGVPASAGEAFGQSDPPELREPCRLMAGLRTSRFMECIRAFPACIGTMNQQA